ncbi:MAG: hypothetical protein SGBAC_005988 [Bacillariaceae sp.]
MDAPCRGEKQRQAPPRTKSVGAADDLVSVTVKKLDPTQKAGIRLVQKGGALYVSKVLKDGLFYDSEVKEGDKILSLNGHRLKRGETAKDFMDNLAQMKDKITVVVKKTDAAPTSAARSLSPSAARRRRRKLVKEEGGRSNDREDHDQYRFRGEKLYSKQPGGLYFHKIEPNLFVSGIASDSIFAGTGVAVGDRVVSVNEVNFLSYSDGRYADTLLKRGEGEVELVVEKGWTTWDPKFTDKKHNRPGEEDEPKEGKRETKVESKDVGIKAPCRRASGSGEVLREEVLGKHKDRAASKDRPKKSTHEAGKGPNGLRFLEHKGDFLCVTIKKKSEKHSGIKIRENNGMFLLKKVPGYEKRVALGSSVVAINGSNFKTEEEAQDLIDQTRDQVVLIIDFEQPVLQECPKCSTWLFPNGEQYK